MEKQSTVLSEASNPQSTNTDKNCKTNRKKKTSSKITLTHEQLKNNKSIHDYFSNGTAPKREIPVIPILSTSQNGVKRQRKKTNYITQQDLKAALEQKQIEMEAKYSELLNQRIQIIEQNYEQRINQLERRVFEMQNK